MRVRTLGGLSAAGNDRASPGYNSQMRVVASDEVRTFVDENGGALYVGAHRRQCCWGAMAVLVASPRVPPNPAADFPADPGNPQVRYRAGDSTEPDELVIELK